MASSAFIDPDDVAISDIDCTLPITSPDAIWRRGVLATAMITIGGSSTPIQTQFFTNGSRASKLVFTMLIDRVNLRNDQHKRAILDVHVPFNPAAAPDIIDAKLRSAFVELHEYVMTGLFTPVIRTAVAVMAIAQHMQMAVHVDYNSFIFQELVQATAIDLLLNAWEFEFHELATRCQEVVAREFANYRPRQFHPFVFEVVCEILERPDLISGGVYTVSDVIQSYIHHVGHPLPVDAFERITAPMTKGHDVNPQHATFFIEQVQGYETRGDIVAAQDHSHRFASFLRRLETMLARNFFSFRIQELMVLRPGLFSNMLLNAELVTKETNDVSNIVTIYLREREKTLSTEEFYTVVKVLDDFAISSSDVLYIANRIEHFLPLCGDLHAGVKRTLAQILATSMDVMARSIQAIPLANFAVISLPTLCGVLSRDALQSGHEDLVFDLVRDYIHQKSDSIALDQIEMTWRTCRFHMLSSACLALAFQEPTLPKSYLAAALIHKQRKASGEIDERKCEFDLYAKSILVLRPRLSLEDLKAREKEDAAMQAVMDAQRIDPQRMSPMFSASEDGLTISYCGDDNEANKGAALFTSGFDCAQGGIFAFELRIEALPKEFWEICVGIADHDHPIDRWVGGTATSWSYLALHSGSRSYHNTICGQYNTEEILGIGATIGVVLDCSDRKSGVVSFTVNAADKGNAFEDLYSHGKGPPAAATPSPGLAGESPESVVEAAIPNIFYPAVSLNRRGVVVRVSRFKWRRH